MCADKVMGKGDAFSYFAGVQPAIFVTKRCLNFFCVSQTYSGKLFKFKRGGFAFIPSVRGALVQESFVDEIQ